MSVKYYLKHDPAGTVRRSLTAIKALAKKEANRLGKNVSIMFETPWREENGKVSGGRYEYNRNPTREDYWFRYRTREGWRPAILYKSFEAANKRASDVEAQGYEVQVWKAAKNAAVGFKGNPAKKKPITDFYVLYADGAFDGIHQGLRNAKREKTDLQKMGFVVKLKGPFTGAQADALEEKSRGY